MNRNWGVGQDSCRVRGCFWSCRCRSTGADFRPRTCIEVVRCRTVYDEFVFVSLFRVFLLSIGPLEQAIRKFTTQLRTAQGNEMAWPRYLRQGISAWLHNSDAARRKIFNTELRIRNRVWTWRKKGPKNLAVAVQQSGSWWGSFVRSVCAFSLWFHTEKIRRQVCLEPDLYVATRCHAFRSSSDVALASPMSCPINTEHEISW